MKIRKYATIALLVLTSFAANGVAPSKTELEGMYDKAFREFDANNYAQALQDLDAIDARQPDLAESQNLRGVILMRRQDYQNAETALRKALAADPKFWNARFNLAEIPFLQKNWAEARKRFQELLNGNASELQGEATQLIQYKILLTYLLEGKENMVDSMLAKFELAPDTPAVHYTNAAIALNKKEEKEAKDWLTNAEKSFSPQLNKLFAESLYTIGWLEKPVGQTRAAIELNSAADRAAKTKEFADAKFEEAEQAFQQRDFTAARKLVDEAESANPNQAAILNLRGEILLEQKEYDQAENEFRKAIKADPKFRDAQYNLAQVPFKKKDYPKARERFEALFGSTTGADKDQAAQLIKFKVYLTWLLEGKDARAQKLMEQFQFTGDTPALYYAQAAWEFKNNNAPKANDWVTSARKIYSPALNGVFSESFFDLGWSQSPALAASPAPMVAEASQPESAPAIEPTPIPAITLAQTDKARPTDPLSIAANSTVSGMEAMTSTAQQSPPASTATVTTPDNAVPTAALSPSVETPVASTASTAAARPVIASAPEPEQTNEVAATADAPAVGTAASTPATVLAPAQVREWSKPTMMETLDRFGDRNTLLVGSLLAGILLLAWVVIPEIRRRFVNAAATPRMSPATVTGFNGPEASAPIEEFVSPTRLMGGPPQVSLQLRASEPALRRAAMPIDKTGRPIGNGAIAPTAEPAPVENRVQPAPVIVPEPVVEDEGMGEPVALQENGASFVAANIEAPSAQAEEFVGEPVATADSFVAEPPAAQFEAPMAQFVEAPAAPELETETETAPAHFEDIVGAPAMTDSPVAADHVEAPFAPQSEPAAEFVAESAAPEMQVDFAPAAFQQPEPIDEQPVVEEPVFEQPIAQEEAVLPAEAPATYEMPAEITPVAAEATAPEIEAFEETSEPLGQGQPIPYQTAPAFNESHASEAPAPSLEAPREQRPARGFIGAALAGIGALRHSVANPPLAQEVESPVPATQQRTTPAIMAQPTQPTPAPVIRTPQPQPQPAQMGGAPQQQPAAGMQQPAAQPVGATQQPAGGMHTAVQLTFSFELASLQLTPTFKMGALQLKPTSKIVTMRLAPSQHPQPAMNLQVTFEVSSVQLNGTSIGMVRLTPSQQQRPGITSTPSFNIAGLQLVSGADAAPVQLTPAQQGQASVLVTAPFQIATVEFSPSFEIASIILNASSRNVNVQLPGTGPSAVEGAPVFEIGNVQLAGNGDIGMMQLNAPGAAPKRA
jgi:tetratricopeptide (TPR) repeat protein